MTTPNTHSSMQPFPDSIAVSQARNARRVALIMIVAVVPTLFAYFFLAFQSGAWQLFVAAGAVLAYFVVILVSLGLIHRGRPEVGIQAMVLGIGLGFLVFTVVIAGFGLLLGLVTMLLASTISIQTLPASSARRTILVSVGLGLATLVLDMLLPLYRLEAPELQTFVPLLLGVLTLIYAFFTVRQFAGYALRTKLILAFLAVSVISVGAVAVYTDRALRASLTGQVGASLKELARLQAVAIGDALARQVDLLQSFSLSKLVQDEAVAVNARYTGDEASIQAEIDKLDQQWRAAAAAGNDTDPLIQSRLNNIVASELKEYRRTFPENAEVFVTDRYGALVASTNRTSDYYQADEGWWQAAFSDGRGAAYIGQPELDQSSGVFGVIIAFPLYAHDSPDLAGILRTTLNLNIVAELLNQTHIGQTGSPKLLLPDGKFLAQNGAILANADLVQALRSTQSDYIEIDFGGLPNLVSQSALTSFDPEEAPVISGLGWTVIVHQDRDESLAPIEIQSRSVVLVAIAIALVMAGAAVGVGQLLTAPIIRLTSVARQVAAGDLKAQARVETADEVGALAQTFNAMTARLHDLITSLEQRVEARTAQLRASADVGHAAASILDRDQLLHEVVNLITDRFGFYYAAVFTLDETGQYAVLRQATGLAGRVLMERGHKLEVGGHSMVGYVTAQRKSRIALDVGDDAVRFANPLLPDTRSEIALPLIVGDRVLGALDVQSVQSAAFDDASAAVLQSMANQIAVALNNAALYTESQKNIAVLNSLLTLSRDIARSRDLNELTRDALKNLPGVVGTDNYYIALVDDKQTEIRFVLQRRGDKETGDEIVTRPFGGGPGFVETVVRTRRSLRISANEAPTRLASLGIKTLATGPRAYLGVPIMVGEQVLGVVGLQDFRPDASFSDYQEKVTVALASQMAVALDNLRLIEDTQRALAELDAANYLLTGQAWERYTNRGGTVYGEWRGGEWVRLNDEVGVQKAGNDPQRQTSNVQLPTSTRSIQLPIKVRGQVIGEFALQPVGDDSDWTPEEIAFGQSLVDQVGQMIETARLLEETERLAGRERTINTINSRVRQSVNMDTILKTAVGELGRSLGAARVFVQLSAPVEDASAAGASPVDPQGTAQAMPAPTTPAGNGKGGDHA